MKTFFYLIVGVIIGYFLGAYSFFRFTVGFGADSISNIIVQSAQDVYGTGVGGFGTGLNQQINKKTQDIVNQVQAKKDEFKENIKQQLIQYMKSKVDQLFSKM